MNAGLPHPRRFFFALAALFALLFFARATAAAI